MTQADVPTSAKPPKSERRWFQYSLLSLLVLSVVFFIAFGFWSNSERQQREAVTVFQKMGAQVDYDYSLPWTCGKWDSPKWPQCLLDHVGVDYFASVQKVNFPLLKVTDAGLEHYELPKVTDAGLEYLENFTCMLGLDLDDTQVTDAGMKHLKNLTALRWLYLANTKITDAGLEHLKCLTPLERLDISDTPVTDSGLDHLKGLSALKWLGLYGTQVTDDGVARLKQALPNCKIEH